MDPKAPLRLIEDIDASDVQNLDAAVSANADVIASKAKTDLISGTTPFDLDNPGSTQNASEVPFTPSGNIVATQVQDAIEELDTETLKINTLNTITNNTQLLNSTNDAGLIINPSSNLSVLRGGGIELSIESTGVSFTGLTNTLINSNGNNSPITKGYADANYLGNSATDYNKSLQNEPADFTIGAIHISDGNKKSVILVDGTNDVTATLDDNNIAVGDTIIAMTGDTTAILKIVPNNAEVLVYDGKDLNDDGVILQNGTKQITLFKLGTNKYKVDGDIEGYQSVPPVVELNTLANALSPTNETNATTGISANLEGGTQAGNLESVPNTDSEGGTHMIRFTALGDGVTAMSFRINGLTIGQDYTVTYRARTDNPNQQRISGFWNGVVSDANHSPTTSWATYTQVVEASDVEIYFRMYLAPNGSGLTGDNWEISYFSVTEV